MLSSSFKKLNYNLVGVVTIKDKIVQRSKQESLIKKAKLNLKFYLEDHISSKKCII